ncbi:hypothetical protein NKH16_19445 [Mesorhizobium sp. M1307]|uniref:hypothetical protein n=1 Tax=Mesorhizobium sp. M1307 TaxID=2957079 RepID=UPI00333C4D16
MPLNSVPGADKQSTKQMGVTSAVNTALRLVEGECRGELLGLAATSLDKPVMCGMLGCGRLGRQDCEQPEYSWAFEARAGPLQGGMCDSVLRAGSAKIEHLVAIGLVRTLKHGFEEFKLRPEVVYDAGQAQIQLTSDVAQQGEAKRPRGD